MSEAVHLLDAKAAHLFRARAYLVAFFIGYLITWLIMD